MSCKPGHMFEQDTAQMLKRLMGALSKPRCQTRADNEKHAAGYLSNKALLAGAFKCHEGEEGNEGCVL